MSLAKEFREFILRGSVVDLAVGVVIGGAFNGLVGAFVKDLITPLVGLAGKHNLASRNFTLHNQVFQLGDFLNHIITFLIMAVVIFFFVVKPVNFLMNLRKSSTPVEATTQDCPRCLSSIPIKATRCAFCTSDV